MYIVKLLTKLKNLSFFVGLLASCVAGHAQNLNQLGGIFGQMMNEAIAEQSRAEWAKMPQDERICMTAGLQRANLSMQRVMSAGISPDDPRLSQMLNTCSTIISKKLRTNVVCSIAAGSGTFSSRCDEEFVNENDKSEKLSKNGVFEAAFAQNGLTTALFERADAQRRREQMMSAGTTSGTVPVPNFDCARAGKEEEVAICNSSILSALDDEYGQLFRRADTPSKGNPAKRMAVVLYNKRVGCGSDEDCIHKNLDTSIEAMAKLLRRRGEKVVTSIDQQRVQAAQQAAQAALEKKREEAERTEEASRIANAKLQAERQAQRAADLPRLVSRGNDLVERASEFLKYDRKNSHLLVIAEAIATVNSSLQQRENDKIAAANDALDKLLRDNPKFEEFLKQKAETEAKENARLLADALAQANKQKRFMESYIAQNPTAPASASAIGLVKSAGDVVGSADLRRLRKQINAVEDMLRQYDLQDNYLLSLNAVDDTPNSKTDAGQSNTALASTPKNHFLLEGAQDDLVLMYVSAPSAPHVIKNLKGDIVFDDASATVCIFSADPDTATRDRIAKALERYKLHALQIAVEPCKPDALLAYDVIATQRGEFLKQDLSYASVLAKEIETNHVKPLVLVSGLQNETELQSIEAKRKQIESDIDHGSLDGYALVILPATTSGAICGALKDDLQAHTALLSRISDPVVDGLKQHITLDEVSFDAVYTDVQRSRCTAVYGRGADLKALLEALRREKTAYHLFETVFSTDDVQKEMKAISEQQNSSERIAQDRVRASDEKRKLEAIRERDRAANAQARQAELREKYGSVADSSAADISSSVKAYLSAGAQPTEGHAGSEVAASYPALANWFASAVRDHWTLQRADSDLVDYGQVDWKGRTMEAAVATVRVKIKNAMLGEYKEGCFEVGHVIDHEFGVTRDPIAVSCGMDGAMASWKQGHNFRSLWQVN